MSYYAGPETLQGGYGGGIIGFCDESTAGSAAFTVRTGAVQPPKEGSTVGGEVSFNNSSRAGTARFTIYGTLGTDPFPEIGDTFGNVVFHDTATADKATFTNIGGTVPGGDGGNTQFYDNSKAAYGAFHNRGGTCFALPKGQKKKAGANGGDVAFDGTSNGGHGHFYNHAAPTAGAYGGVTSFNNNWPHVTTGGASAGNGSYHQFGAKEAGQGGGGHIEFSAKYGSPTADNASFFNYGSVIEGNSSAGHTIFSISQPTNYFPTAGNGTFWNHPALAKGGAAGYTEFSVYSNSKSDSTGTTSSDSNVPTAGDGTFHNLGGCSSGIAGSSTTFGNTSSAGNAQLIAYGGTNGGDGGQIVFKNESSGGTAYVQLSGNGVLDISYHYGGLTIDTLDLTEGIIKPQLGKYVTGLTVSKELILKSTSTTFSFYKSAGFEKNKSYTILTAPNLSKFTADQFSGNKLDDVWPTFTIVGNDLQVSFGAVEAVELADPARA